MRPAYIVSMINAFVVVVGLVLYSIVHDKRTMSDYFIMGMMGISIILTITSMSLYIKDRRDQTNQLSDLNDKISRPQTTSSV